MSETTSLVSPETIAYPFPVYDRIRLEQPVYRSPELGMVVVTSHADVVEVLRDETRFSAGWLTKAREAAHPNPSIMEVLAEGFPDANVLVYADGDAHRFHAEIVRPFFTPTAIRSLARPFEVIARDLTANLPTGESIDLVAEFSTPMAIQAMCEFVGVPLEKYKLFSEGADAAVALRDPAISEEEGIEAARTYVEFQHYIADQLRDRQKSPRNDPISAIANSEPSHGQQPLSLTEMVNMTTLLITAGNETTRGALTSCLRLLAEKPEFVPHIMAEDARLDAFIEEALRARPPIMSLFRVVTRDTVLGGVELKQGEMIAVCYGAGNYDPGVFDDPYEFDPGRRNLRRHLAFGMGVHFCMGAPVARLETKVALRQFFQRFQRVELDPARPPEFYNLFIVHNMRKMHAFLHEQ